MTDLDALDRAFLKGSGVPSLPNKGKSAVVDPLDAAFMRGLGQTPTAEVAKVVDPIDAAFMRGLGQSTIAEVANTPRRVPFTPTPVSPRAMAGAIIRGAGEGLASGPIPTFAKNVGQSFVSGVATIPGDLTYGLFAQRNEIKADQEAKEARRILGFTEYKLSGSAPRDAKSIAELDKRLPNWRDYQKLKYLPPEEVKALRDAGFQLDKRTLLGSLEYKMAQNKLKPGTFSDEEIAKEKEAARVLQESSKKRLAKADDQRDWQTQAREIFTPELAKVDQGDKSKSAHYGRVAGSAASSLAVAAAAGPTAGSLLLASLEAQGAYDNAVREGISPTDAGAIAGQAFIWSAMSEWPQLELMKDARGFVKGAVGGAASEIPQEVTQQIGLNIISNRPWDEGLDDSAVGALFAGGGVGGVKGKINSIQDSRAATPKQASLNAAAWIIENADMLPTIAAKEKLSRNDWQKLGLPRVPEAVRAAFLQKVKDTVAEPKFPEPGSVLPQPAKDALLPKPSGLELPLNEETKARIQKVRAEVQAELDAPTEAEAEANKPAETPVVAEAESVAERKKGKRFPKAPVPEANAAVDEVQTELNAQAAEDAADEAAYALFGKREAKTPVPDATATPVEPEAPVPTDTAAEVVKPVETPVVAEAKAVEERKKGKRVPKALKPVKKVKGVVEPVVEAPVVKESLSTPVEQPTTREVKTGLKGQTKTVPVEIPTNGEPTTTIVGRMDMAEFERMGYEPDEVTRQNWVDLQRAERRRLGQREEGDNPNAPWAEYEEFHRDSVKRSLAKGDVVDERVLADYPELQTREVKTGRKGVTKKAGGESVLPSAANAEQAETIEGRFIKQLPSGRWVVQSEENRQRAERGEREIGGDRLFASREEAVKETKLEIEIDRRNAALKATEAAAQAEREAAAAKREAPLNAYLDTITTTPLQRGKLKTTLSKQVARRVSSTGKVYSGSKFEVVNQMVGDGFKADAVEVDAIKDVSRVQWNRMDERQQREWDARRKAAGKKTEYRLVGADKSYYVVTKVEHDLAKAVETSSSPTAPTSPPQRRVAEVEAPPAPEVSYPAGAENIEQKRTRLQETRNEASKIMLQIDDKIKEADRFAQQNNILITVGRHRGQLKKALPKSKVEPYNKLKEEIRKLNAIVVGMRENVEYPLRKEIEKAGLIATVNDASMPKLSRLAARVDLYSIDGSTVPKDVEASLMAEAKAMVKQAYPDATEAEAAEMAPYVRSNAAVLAKESQPITPEWIRDEGSRSMTLDISGIRRGEVRKYAQQKGVLNYNLYPEAFATGESLKQFDDLLSGKVSRESVDAAKKAIDAEAKAMKVKADEAAKQAAAAAAEEEKRVQEERQAMADFLSGDLEGPVSDLREKLREIGNGRKPTGQINPKPVEEKVAKAKDVLRAIESHASDDITRFILTGVHVGSYKQRKVAVATDGRRLIMLPYDGDQKVDTTVRRLPSKQAKEMGKEYEVIDGVYPNFMQVVPPLADLEGNVPITPGMVARLRGAVKAARIVPDKVSMSAVVTAKINGTVTPAAINAKFVLEAIDALTAAGYVPTKILMKATHSPIMIATENKHAFAVMMPMKIEAPFPNSGLLHFYMNGTPVVPESPPPMTKGVGAAAARGEGEFINARRPVGETEAVNATGLRESVAEIERRALQMPPEVKDAARTFPEVAEKAWKRMQESSTAAQDLIDELMQVPRPLTDVEVAMLTIEKVRRWNERNNAASETVKLANSGDETAKAAAKLRYEVAARRMEELFDVAARGRGKSITETARGLSALRMMMDDEFELVSMEQTVRDKQGGKSLSEQQQAELAKIKADYDAAKKRLDAEVNRLTEDLDAKTKELAESKANADFLKMVNEVTATQDKSPLRKRMLTLADRLEAEALASMKARGARMSAGVDPTVLLDMGKLGAAYIIRGSVTLADWTAKMRSVFADASDEDLNRARDEAERIARGTRDEAMSEQAKQRKTERGKAQGGQSELSKEVKALMREQVEAGVTTLDEAIVNVHKELVDAYEGITTEQVRDAFSDYGKARPLNADDVSRILADLRRQAQLVASIERVQQQLAPLKSGPQRDKPSQIARQLTRELNRLMREAGIKTTNEETQIASALQAKKTRMENAIADMEKALAENKRMEPGSLLPVENDDEANQIEARLNDLREQYDAAFPREPLTIEQRLERATKAAERSLEQANQRLRDARSGKFPSKEKSALPFNERLAAVREERDAANAEVERLRELAEPGKKAIEAKKRRLQTAIKEVERRIREKDFAVREQKRIDISGDPEAMAAQIEYERVKNEYAAMKERARRDARTPLEVAKETGLEVMDAQRNILASFDVSAVGRQGWYAFMSHPVIGLKATARMLQAFKRGNSAVIAEKLRSRKNYPLYQQAKLGIVDDDGTGNFSHVEDRFRLDLVGKLPGINLSNRAYATFLNAIRADAFDSMLANSRDPSDVSREKIEALARGINELTGRGELGRLSPETLARFMWAPRFLKSAFDILTVRPLRTGTKETRIIFGKEYLRAAASMAVIYMLAGLFRGDDDEPIEWDPRSSDFGAIPVGKHKVNPLGYVRTLLTFMARNVTGVTVAGGQKRKLRKFATAFDDGAKEPQFGSGMEQVWMRFAQSKAHPTIGTAFSVFSGKEFGGKDITPGGVVKDMTIPLALREAYQTMMIDDPDAAVALSLMLMLGIDVKPDYASPEYLRFEAKDEAAFKDKVGKLLVAATDPSASDAEVARGVKASQSMSPEDRRAALRDAYTGKVGSDSYRRRMAILRWMDTKRDE